MEDQTPRANSGPASGGPSKPPRPRGPSQTSSTGKPTLVPPAEDGEERVSNAEIKKRKQAAKAARRAQTKGTAPPSATPAATPTPPSRPSAEAADSSKKPQTLKNPGKPQHKRSPSTQKALPVRPIQQPEKKGGQPKQQKQDAKRVALFSHLYGQSRSSSIIGAGKDIHPAILALGLQMSSYVVCGSSARCVATLQAFKRVIESYTTPPGNSLPRHLTSHLNAQIEYLVSCRPLATAMGNAIRWLKVEINDVDPDTEELQAKSHLCRAIDRFILERITAADHAIADAASSKIVDGDVVLTFAKSHIVQSTLLEAHARGRRFRVIVVDARPLFEGRNLARALVAAGLEVQYTLTHALGHVAGDATKVLLGAHAMLSNGRLYARAGTALVALMAHAQGGGAPVIVCCESIKFSDKVALDAIVANEVASPDELVVADPNTRSPLARWRDLPNLQLLNLMFDVTPAEYITMVVTEYGSLPPSSVPVVHALSTNT